MQFYFFRLSTVLLLISFSYGCIVAEVGKRKSYLKKNEISSNITEEIYNDIQIDKNSRLTNDNKLHIHLKQFVTKKTYKETTYQSDYLIERDIKDLDIYFGSPVGGGKINSIGDLFISLIWAIIGAVLTLGISLLFTLFSFLSIPFQLIDTKMLEQYERQRQLVSTERKEKEDCGLKSGEITQLSNKYLVTNKCEIIIPIADIIDFQNKAPRHFKIRSIPLSFTTNDDKKIITKLHLKMALDPDSLLTIEKLLGH